MAAKTESKPQSYDKLIEQTKEVALLGSTGALLAWDQETMMPGGGIEHRARQLDARRSHQLGDPSRTPASARGNGEQHHIDGHALDLLR